MVVVIGANTYLLSLYYVSHSTLLKGFAGVNSSLPMNVL